MLAVLGHVGDQGRGGGTGAYDDNPLALVVQVLRPGLGVDDRPPEFVHTLPLGCIALLVAVVALAHPQEAGGEVRDVATVSALRLNNPVLVFAGPGGAQYLVLIANVLVDVVVLDSLSQVVQDRVGRGDRFARPGLEAIAEGVQVAVRTHARVTVLAPGTAE